MTIEKPKLPKGLSYALKTSILQEAIESAGLDCHINLNYWTPQKVPGGDTILECFYWLPNANVDHDRFYIRAGSIKSEQRKTAENLLREKVIPVFIKWMKKIKSFPPDSPRLRHNLYFNAVFIDNDVSIYHDDLS
jgi:hypothetical protein